MVGSEHIGGGDIDLRIVHFTDNRIMDPRGRADLPYREFHHARNKVLGVRRRFGTIGSMDDFPLDPGLTEKEANSKWNSTGINHPHFFVLDAQLNHERCIYIEIGNKSLFSIEWLSSVVECLNGLGGWAMGITNINQGYILIFRDVMLVNGPTFEACKDIENVLSAARDNLP